MRSRNLLHLCTAVAFAMAAIMTACVGDDAPTLTVAPSVDGGGLDGHDGATDGTDASSVVDGAGTDAGTDASPTPYDVRKLAGLRLWLESTQHLEKAAVGNDVVSWKDSSERWADGGSGAPDGGVHNAMPIPFNGGGAVYPTVVTNGIAGRPSVAFESGPKLGIANHADFDVETGDFFIAFVAAINAGSGSLWSLMTSTTAPTGTWLGSSKFCSFLGGLGGAQPKCTSPEYSPNTSPHAFIVRRKANQAIFRVDGTSRGTYDFGADSANLGVLDYQQILVSIGGAIVGQVSEVVVVVGATQDADFEAFEAYLEAKYALP